jgi:hypothetical protein
VQRAVGAATLLAFVDHGCAFAHRQFQCARHGRPGTRVLALWDQADDAAAAALRGGRLPLAWQRPAGFGYGRETLRDGGPVGDALRLDEYIDQYRRAAGRIDEERCYAECGNGAALRPATHGTHMMDIATGHPSPLARLPHEPGAAAAPHEADIVFVQLPRAGRGRQLGGMLRAQVFDAMRYVLGLAGAQTRVVVNLSYGTYGGPHDGSSILEEAIDRLVAERAKPGRLDVVVAAGNAYDKKLHARARIEAGQTACFVWHNLPDDPTDSFVELWLPTDAAEVEVRVIPPGARAASGWLRPGQVTALRGDGDEVFATLVHARRTCQGRARRMVLLAVAPTRSDSGRRAAPYGTWQIELHSDQTVTVRAWCERDDPGFGSEAWPRQGEFSQPRLAPGDARVLAEIRSDDTLSSLANGQRSTIVGAVVCGGTVAAYSSTGPLDDGTPDAPGRGQLPRRRPTVLAPAEENAALPGLAAAATLGSETVRLNGTSVAAAYVTRLLLEGRYNSARRIGPEPPANPVRPSTHPDEAGVPRLPRAPQLPARR